ncbi:MAG TPA: aminopeptidase [Gaiellales bacterium]
MSDPRLESLAELICGYSLDVQADEIIRITGPASAHEFIAAITRQVTRRGGMPMLRPSFPAVEAAILSRGSDEQLTTVTEIDRLDAEVPRKTLTIWADENTRYMSEVPPDRQALWSRARREISDRFFDRLARGEIGWCGVTLPTQGFAQDAGMSLAEFEDFVFGAGHVNDPDPVAFWRGQSQRQAAVIERLSGISELRIVAEDTDLTLDVSGRPWINADGHENFPDGEVFTSPHHERTSGHITFSFDATYHGREFGGVRLWFEDGRVVRHEAARGEEFLAGMLDMDEGSRFLGEVAFGMNDDIQRATQNVAFDEKIGGTAHVALGAAFPEAGGTNRSSLHWDIVRDLRQGGEVYGDGQLIGRDGAFL